MPKSARAETLKEIKEKVKAIRDAGYLKSGYAKKIAEKVGVEEGKIYQVAAGNEYHEAVVDEILKMAEDNKLANQIERANKILKD